MKQSKTCRCLHSNAAHEHLRGGTDCSTCLPGLCVRYRGRSTINRLLHRVTDNAEVEPEVLVTA